MKNNAERDQKISECHNKIAEYLEKAARLQKQVSGYCWAGEMDKAKAASFDTMGYLFAAMKYLKKSAKHCAGIECKCCKKEHKMGA